MNFELNPKIVLSDFEIAFMSAARDMFPNSNIKGCHFHLTQAIYMQVILKGLKYQYLNVRTVSDFFQKLKFLNLSSFIQTTNPETQEMFLILGLIT